MAIVSSLLRLGADHGISIVFLEIQGPNTVSKLFSRTSSHCQCVAEIKPRLLFTVAHHLLVTRVSEAQSG